MFLQYQKLILERHGYAGAAARLFGRYARRLPVLELVLAIVLVTGSGAKRVEAEDREYSQHSTEVRLALLDVESRLLDERADTQREIDTLTARVNGAKKRLDDLEKKLTVVRSNLSNLN